MERQYDLFQVQPDGTLIWRETVAGHAAAIDRLQQLARLESCEFRLLYLPDKTVIATMNTPKRETPRKAPGA
jgi:hypothetical protein